jgi:hypothetical protein
MFSPHTFLMLSTLLNVGSVASYAWVGDWPRAWYFASAASLNLCLWVGLK